MLDTDCTVTTTGPLNAPAGTVATIAVSLQLVIVALTPSNVTEPAVLPKLAPLIVTDVPCGPAAGLRLLIKGAPNITGLLCSPLLATITLPTPAPAGTVAVMEVSDQAGVVAATPLKVTVPALLPKPVPVIATDVPTGP